MKNKADGLGDRMKANYEQREQTYLTRRTPVIMRLDGKAFHTFTRGVCMKPFDAHLHEAMVNTTKALIKDIQGAQFGYTQSDEISILITDWESFETQAWFDYNVQKMVSVSASIAAVTFNNEFGKIKQAPFKAGFFDCRVFNLPKEEVQNYFLWRWLDWQRNSVSMLAQANFSHKSLQGKSQIDMKAMLEAEGKPWGGLPDKWKYGTFVDREGQNNINLKLEKKWTDWYMEHDSV